MDREAFQVWLSEADGSTARQREEAARVLAEPASLAAVLGRLEARIDEARRCPHGAVEGAVIPNFPIVAARTVSGGIAARVVAGRSMP